MKFGVALVNHGGTFKCVRRSWLAVQCWVLLGLLAAVPRATELTVMAATAVTAAAMLAPVAREKEVRDRAAKADLVAAVPLRVDLRQVVQVLVVQVVPHLADRVARAVLVVQVAWPS
jgi:hypothetical protein